jgi:hypothetical protein
MSMSEIGWLQQLTVRSSMQDVPELPKPASSAVFDHHMV